MGKVRGGVLAGLVVEAGQRWNFHFGGSELQMQAVS